MKKLVFLLATLFGVTLLHAGARSGSSPETSGGAAVFPEYGGFSYTTSAFSVNGATIAGAVDIVGAFFSSGTASDYVSIWTATSTTGGLGQASAQEIYRIYNIANSTGGFSPAGIGGGFNPALGTARGSLRVLQNVIWFVNNATHNIVSLLFNKE